MKKRSYNEGKTIKLIFANDSHTIESLDVNHAVYKDSVVLKAVTLDRVELPCPRRSYLALKMIYDGYIVDTIFHEEVRNICKLLQIPSELIEEKLSRDQSSIEMNFSRDGTHG